MGPSDGLTAGAVVGFIFLTYRFLEPIAEFTEILDQTQTAVAGLRRVLSVLDMPVGPPAPDDPDPAARPARSDRHRRRHVRLSESTDGEPHRRLPCSTRRRRRSRPASRWRWSERPGSGKTTLGRLIARFADPTDRGDPLGGVPLRRVTRRTASATGRRVAGAVPVRRHRSSPTSGSRVRARPPTTTSSGSSTNSVRGTGSTRCPTGCAHQGR